MNEELEIRLPQDKPIIKFKKSSMGTDCRLIYDNKRIDWCTRQLTYKECEAFCQGFLGGRRIGNNEGRFDQSNIVVHNLQLLLK